jgi:hypothetical protein
VHIQARRIFRLSGTMALTLAVAYGLAFPLPFIAPIFALMLTLKPAPPMGWKSLVGLLLLTILTTGVGLVLTPFLVDYGMTGFLLVAVGIYLSSYISVNKGKALVGTFLTIGVTLITAAGTLSSVLSTTVIEALVLGIALAVLCQRVVYVLFPEDPVATKPAPSPAGNPDQSNWIAIRGTLIILPAYLLALTNPAMYLAIIMKAVSLGLQSSTVNAKNAGRELLGSTFLGGVFAILFWVLLDLLPNLWLYFWCMLLFGIYFSSKIYQLIPSRHPASFWVNVATTLLILLGPAVEDSANGKDVYAAFAVRIGLFIAVTLYAWAAIFLLEHLRSRRRNRVSRIQNTRESPTCS